MDTMPTINISRGVITVLTPDQASLVYQYYLANRDHLAPWEPKRDVAFHSLSGWQERLTNSFELFQQGIMLPLVVLNQQKSEMIACCNFSNIVRGVFQACHLGYSVDIRYQGMGLMHEALSCSISYLFEQLDLHRIMANYLPNNLRSEALLKKLGFQKEGYAKSYLKINGQWQDHILTALVNPKH
ncbi:ribosomal protein S5-alanine N-acetyltransferase [Endozoicomonas sp. SM1973]|uniref:[Ribosomal protein uS5]-alanine N-acetyltransferase n=1 Tax=Spartinivicinus marinus TaxID=2994442 RepID=A0A853I9V9_9GAMM|nr:ribosomal protein S5-alanine N-acetyltransferase [Spartinivicinus marinus]MCX4027233.1 ribosomal protein S5-alanine N-acetyltransferase [Spartinivicinus marinus]NYZ66045.1 ribosomal protein S5-alanine N-acetyltransferase [Spartinivicinus marinus]